MATAQKKTGSRQAPAKRTSSTKGKSAKSAKKAPRPVRRGVGAVICLVLAFFAVFGYFDVDALFINFYCKILKGILGYGFWIVPPALLMASYILAFHRGRPVQMRLWCTLLLPLMAGVILHLIFNQTEYLWDWSIFSALWTDGAGGKSGGVMGGILALGCALAFSRLGTGILFAAGAVMMVLGAFNLTVVDVVDYFRSRERLEYEEEILPERRPKLRRDPEPEPEVPARRKPNIDIPVDEPSASPEPVEQPPKRERFFNRKPAVPTPDQVLSGVGEEPVAVRETEEEPFPIRVQPIPTPAFTPTPSTVPPSPAPEIVREPAVPKAKPSQAAQAAVEVAHDIEKKLTEGPPAYQYPPVSLLKEGEGIIGADAIGELKNNQVRLSDTIRSFGIEANIVNVTRGPSVTRYELELDQGVRLNKLTNLADDIALALGATGVRIAPIPDKISMVGIEVPNKLVSPVYIHEVIDSKEFRDHSSKVCFAVGKDIGGNSIVGNIAKLPHLLIAGTTGSGKSVCTNSLIVSLLYKATPEEVRLIMVDPKMVELGIYNGIPHLLIPVVTDPKKAAGALQWAVTEMMKRYRAFSEVGVRDLASYNAHVARTEGMAKMPQVVVVIDELADLMLVAAKEVEESICRVAQMGRASGMHLIIATQRPSADVITGLMKANIPSRIAFAVASSLESRIILDTTGAEKLVGRGDMLYFPLGTGKPQRVQGCLISDEEVANVVEFVKRSGGAEYDEAIIHEIEQHAAEKEKGSKGVGGSAPDEVGDDYDELLPAAIEVVVETGMASVSMLQRRLKLGYSRAARLVDQMEEKGIVGPFEGSKPRQLLITKEQWQEMQFRQGMVDVAPDMGAVPEEFDYEGDAIPQGRDLPPFDMGD
ncbi:FtsK/SpoIIIE family protein [uncultured Eubacteriales bacterium]|uniref:FtsK/SpoIIIE family protein n=1 Tax=uncultured Eubacteriales bacterium TaxID=172733 RepID=A0A212JXT1_9FIRM|nr:FtsK/SpoIIIE family protein [uncultured Eubacteriales bacterium]